MDKIKEIYFPEPFNQTVNYQTYKWDR